VAGRIAAIFSTARDMFMGKLLSVPAVRNSDGNDLQKTKQEE
jgi:hypothetical protein